MSVTVPHTKAARHALVTSLLTRGTVHSQQQLAELLTAEGVTVTQATLSRDLVELRAVKIRTPSGALAYAVPAEGGLRTPAAGPDDEMLRSLVGSEMCIRDSLRLVPHDRLRPVEHLGGDLLAAVRGQAVQDLSLIHI